MFQDMLAMSAGGGSTPQKIGTKTARPSNAETVIFDLSDLDVNKLYEDFFPVLTATTQGSNSSSTVSMTFTFTFDESTKKLTLKLGGNTSYIWLSIYGGYCSVDIYKI